MFVFRLIFLFFIVVAFTEVIVFIKVGEWIGLFWTIAMVVLTAAMGVSLLRIQGTETVKRMQQVTAAGGVPGLEIVEAVMLLVAGALLLTPGFLTDIAGFLLIAKPTRQGFAKAIMAKGFATMFAEAQKRSYDGEASQQQPNPFQQSREGRESRQGRSRPTQQAEVIEGEFQVKQDPNQSNVD